LIFKVYAFLIWGGYTRYCSEGSWFETGDNLYVSPNYPKNLSNVQESVSIFISG
jgi:hypothetical protein